MSDMTRTPNADELLRRAAKMHADANDVLEEVGKLNTVIASLDWIGNRADRFRAAWSETQSSAQHWAANLHDAANVLENRANTIIQTQSDSSNEEVSR